MELNVEQLDQLVSSFLARCCEKEPGSAPEEELRLLLLGGAFTAAAARLAQLCPSLARCQWLQFQLKRHHFMHLARMASADGDSGSKEERAQQLQEALDLARRELAPLALHAYCEAYADFKQCMLALVADSRGSDGNRCGGSSSSGGTGDVEPSADLEEFAGMMARAVRQEVGCNDSSLTQLLRYLLLLHQHQHHTGFHPHWWPSTSSQTLALCEQLLLPRHDAMPPAALEPVHDSSGSGLPASGVREHDVQALRTSLGCDREEAVTLLRRARGNAFKALLDALQAAHLDEHLLQELAQEYAACRGLEPLPQAGAAGDGAEGMQVDDPQQQQQQRRRSPAKPAKKARGAAGSGALGETGNGAAAAAAPEAAHAMEGAEAADIQEVEAVTEEEVLELPAELSEQQLRQLIQRLEHLLAAGQADKVLQQLQAAEPSFLPDHPAAAFALHRCRFLDALAAGAGSTAAALAVVRQHLSPLAQQHSELQLQLKAALAMLLPLPGPGSSGSGDSGAAASQQQQLGVADALAALRSALRPRCHVREPRLLALLRDLMNLHAAHFKLQRCQDRFASDLGLSALKASASTSTTTGGATATGSGTGAATAAAAAVAAAVAAEAQQAALHRQRDVPVPGVRELASESDEDEDMQEGSDEGGSDGEAGVPEESIITVCEFTGLPRHTAIELLLMHGGDAAAVLAHMFP